MRFLMVSLFFSLTLASAALAQVQSCPDDGTDLSAESRAALFDWSLRLGPSIRAQSQSDAIRIKVHYWVTDPKNNCKFYRTVTQSFMGLSGRLLEIDDFGHYSADGTLLTQRTISFRSSMLPPESIVPEPSHSSPHFPKTVTFAIQFKADSDEFLYPEKALQSAKAIAQRLQDPHVSVTLTAQGNSGLELIENDPQLKIVQVATPKGNRITLHELYLSRAKAVQNLLVDQLKVKRPERINIRAGGCSPGNSKTVQASYSKQR